MSQNRCPHTPKCSDSSYRQHCPSVCNTVDKGDKYRKTIGSTGGTATVDVYDVLKAFEVTCPAMQHALKKMLCAGLRGHKDFNKDVDEAIVSLQRAKELAGA